MGCEQWCCQWMDWTILSLLYIYMNFNIYILIYSICSWGLEQWCVNMTRAAMAVCPSGRVLWAGFRPLVCECNKIAHCILSYSKMSRYLKGWTQLPPSSSLSEPPGTIWVSWVTCQTAYSSLLHSYDTPPPASEETRAKDDAADEYCGVSGISSRGVPAVAF